jgi:hypothetical protein
MGMLTKIKKQNIDKPYNFEPLSSEIHYPSSTRYWDNSVYTYNEKNSSLISIISDKAKKYIRNYLHIFNEKTENRVRRNVIYDRRKRLSINKIFLSNGEFKHTNNKVIVSFYVYNKQKNNYLIKLKKRFLNKILANNINLKNETNNQVLPNRILLLKKLKKVSTNGNLASIDFNIFKPKIARILINLQKKNKVTNLLIVSKYVNEYYKKYIKKSLKKLFIYTYYKKLMYINKSKFNYTFLQFIINTVQTLFNKNVELNFINLKHFFLNSNIFSESILLKIKKNRRRFMKHLSNLQNKVIIKKKRVVLGELVEKKNLNNLDYFHNNISLYRNVINSLKYKHITGFRLEAKGRLNKRYTAARSINKLKYKGNLLNSDSSYRGLSSVLLRNNLNSNLQYTKSNAKTRIGSFGLKTWISSN